MNRPTRFYLALHATLAAALVGAMALHLGPIPAHWPALAQRPVWTVWVLIGLWLALSAAGVALRPLGLWRVAMGVATAALLALGLGGWALGTSLAGSLLAGLAACALACAGLAAVMAPARIQAPRAAGKAVRAVAGAVTATPMRAPWWQRMAGWPHWPFVLVAAVALESFRLGHIVAAGAARPSGMAGLLIAFFLALPAATLRHWWPRWAAALWLLAGTAFAGLAFKSGLPQWAVATALCLWQPLWTVGKTMAVRTRLGAARHLGDASRSSPGTESAA
ncbi:hypothetical protein EAG14_16280 [Acidovorax sp. 1608163]|uniref:hypothetical protein n=1 Tax=Acidovorax sp. 1608163 TaxID=2478662 RepID=UPI000EF644F9|nr:hypothetical protein [Acidovorax sp. 1608163]AYM97355.1 hypothetical protein EAG14_16280 [Acidovorax sp. 1608163]